ncbi:MAG: SDR family oxidoreductase [Polyangiaceae bacterium]|nr:SDR family oxidoreductase [Polyangiaceae bacterium]
MNLLNNQVAIITGAARGIGLAIARSFAAEGAKLVLLDNGCEKDGSTPDFELVKTVGRELEREGAEVLALPCDISNEAQVERAFEAALERFSQIDILVNNANTLRDRSIFDMSLDDWDRVLSVGLRGAFICSRAFARTSRKARSGGKILNISGISGFQGNISQANDSAVNAGLFGLTRTTSIELQRFGICVNAIAPIAKTRQTEHLPMFDKVQGTMEPDHIAPAAVYLTSELSEDLSGAVISVAGGRLSTYQLAESRGRMKESEGGLWTPQEIADNFDSLSRL